MVRTFRKSFSALALSAALAVTAITVPAAPARADAEDIAGVLAGIAALYIIGRAIEQHNDRGNSQVTRHVTPQPQRPAHRLIAPARCFREFWSDQGYVRGYGARCMQRHVARPGSLPPECIRRVTTDRGVRNLYRGRCLARNGWEREAGFRP